MFQVNPIPAVIKESNPLQAAEVPSVFNIWLTVPEAEFVIRFKLSDCSVAPVPPFTIASAVVPTSVAKSTDFRNLEFVLLQLFKSARY